LTIFSSRWFVISIEQASPLLGLAPFIVSVFLSPIATELPEASNVVLWMRRREDSLALGNVLGAMMFQTSITCAIAILATPWQLGPSAYSAGSAALVAVGLLIASTISRRRVEPLALVACGLLYVAYVFYVARL
jgi:cation:H+ antiporter